MTALAGLAAAGAVLALAATRRPVRARVLPQVGARPTRADLLAAVGAALRRRARLHASPLTDRTLAVAAATTVVLAAAALPVAGLLAVGTWAQATVTARRAAAAAARATLASLPEAIDLLRLCTGAGLTLPLAQPLVAARAPAPLGSALAAAHAAAGRGVGRADALVAHLTPLGPRAAALGRLLADHLRYGLPLGPALERLGLEVRLDRRRRAERDARRVPVRLLGPLVACVLPAFGLLTVVPLLVASLGSLPS